MGFLRRIADHTQDGSVATRMRRRRFGLFLGLLDGLRRPVKILDVGGTEGFWEMMGFFPSEEIEITLLNVVPIQVSRPYFRTAVGDARDMSEFTNGEFDVVFSNSVIEHVGALDDQRKMASEIRRVGDRYFVQTPNWWFPMEPHFLIPVFHWLPAQVRAWLLTRFALGRMPKIRDRAAALAMVEGIHLLTRRRVRKLFPEGVLYRERLFGLTKSFIVYDGWNT